MEGGIWVQKFGSTPNIVVGTAIDDVQEEDDAWV